MNRFSRSSGVGPISCLGASRRRSSWALILAALVATALAVGPSASRAATGALERSWAQFQGNGAHIGSLSSGIAPPLKRLWTFEIPEDRLGTAGAIIVGEVAIALGENAVVGVDLETGEERWSVDRAGGPLTLPAAAEVGRKTILTFSEVGSDGQSELLTQELGPRGPKGSPDSIPLDDISISGVSVDDDRAFMGDRNGRIYAVDLSSNEVAWKSTAGIGRIEAPPAVSNGLVFAVGRDGDTGEVRVVALDEETGREEWLFAPSFAVGVGSGVTVAEGRVFFGMGDVEVHALDVETGTERWSTRVRSQFSPFVAPAYADGQLYIVGTSGSESALYRLGARTGDRSWDFEFTSEDLRSSPVVVGDTVYVGLADGTLAQINRGSGVEFGEDHTGSGSLGAISVARDILVVGKNGPRGGLVAFGPDPEGHRIHVLSPTHLRLHRVLINFALAFAAVVLLLFLGFRVLVRARTAGPEPGQEPGPEPEQGWLPDEVEGETREGPTGEDEGPEPDGRRT